jgi:hypothetical protein
LNPIIDRIIALPAQTHEGMKVKARVTFFSCVGDTETDNDASAMSIVRDLLRMQSAAPMSDHEYVRVGARKLFSQPNWR